MPLLNLRHHPDQLTCDGRWEFIQLLDDGRTKINNDEVPERDLAALVGDIMKSRAERAVYVIPSSGISYSRFVETLNKLNEAVPDLHIGVLSGKVRDAYEALSAPNSIDRVNAPCDIEWPAGEF